jgi:hypothetical protein
MRSELVFGASLHIQNRYLLARLTSKTMRIFHRPHTRVEETANQVLQLFSQANPQQMQGPPSSSKRHPTPDGLELATHETQHKRMDVAENDLARMVGCV